MIQTIKKGDKFLCIKDGVMSDGSIVYYKGEFYKSEIDECITDRNGDDKHFWGSVDNEYFKRIDNNMEQKEDKVNHPSHYCSHPSGVECIDIARYYCFSIGNVFKYIWRAGLKIEKGMNDKEKEIQDLKKAIFYLNDRIKQLENAK